MLKVIDISGLRQFPDDITHQSPHKHVAVLGVFINCAFRNISLFPYKIVTYVLFILETVSEMQSTSLVIQVLALLKRVSVNLQTCVTTSSK